MVNSTHALSCLPTNWKDCSEELTEAGIVTIM